MTRLLIALAVALPLLAGALSTSVSGQHRRSIWDGAYTDAQADRGFALYKTKCTMCHGPALGGAIDGGPPLRGTEFFVRWSGTALNDMVDQIAELMPSENPNSLKRQEYVDIIMFFLRSNGVPAGSKELTADDETLSTWEFTEKR
jgi:cytochrome c